MHVLDFIAAAVESLVLQEFRVKTNFSICPNNKNVGSHQRFEKQQQHFSPEIQQQTHLCSEKSKLYYAVVKSKRNVNCYIEKYNTILLK